MNDVTSIWKLIYSPVAGTDIHDAAKSMEQAYHKFCIPVFCRFNGVELVFNHNTLADDMVKKYFIQIKREDNMRLLSYLV